MAIQVFQEITRDVLVKNKDLLNGLEMLIILAVEYVLHVKE